MVEIFFRLDRKRKILILNEKCWYLKGVAQIYLELTNIFLVSQYNRSFETNGTDEFYLVAFAMVTHKSQRDCYRGMIVHFAGFLKIMLN